VRSGSRREQGRARGAGAIDAARGAPGLYGRAARRSGTDRGTATGRADTAAAGLRRRPWRWALLALLALAPTTASSYERAGPAAKLPQIHLSVRPALAEANAITSFRFVATRRVGDERRPVRGATIRFAGARARTGRRGRAVIVRRLDTGVYRPHACKRGLECGVARVVALPHG
jgi:hypothetical protein